jgi:hypothetical protein
MISRFVRPLLIVNCQVVILLSSCLSLNAQNERNITGKVTNTEGGILSNSNVAVLSAVDSSYIAYSTTDSKGNYKINFAGENVFVRVSYLGYRTQEKSVDETTSQLDFVLESTTNILPPLIVKGRYLGAIVKGDTISYNLDKYNDGTEQTLKDILKKLPGIEVDEEGEVSAQGKKIDRLLIDGKEFFLNQSQMATRNLPAKLVEGVDLINNYTDLSVLGDSKPMGITALNVTIKEKYKGRLSGTLTGAGGINTKYSAKSNLFNFNKNFGLALIGDVGNTGEMAFTLNDYIKFQRNITQITRYNKSSDAIVLDMQNIPRPAFSEDVRTKPSETAAVNLNYIPNKKLKINSYLIANHQAQKGTQSVNRRLIDDNKNIYNQILDNKNKFLFSNLYFSGDYKHSNNLFISNRAMVSAENRGYNTGIMNFQNDIFDTLLSNDKSTSFDLRDYMLLLYKTERGDVLNVDVQYRYYNRPVTLDLESDFIMLGLPLRAPEQTDMYHAIQDNKQSANEIIVQSAFSLRLKNGIMFIPQFGINYSAQNINTLLAQYDAGKYYYFDPLDNFTNDVAYNNFDLSTGFHLRKNTKGIFRYEIGLEGHYHSSSKRNKEEYSTREKWNLSPYLHTSLYFSGVHRLQASFGTSQQLRQINDLLDNKIITDYKSVVQGSMTDYLYPQSSATLSYVFSDFYKGTTLIFVLHYNDKQYPSSYNYVSHGRYSESYLKESDNSQTFTSLLQFKQGLGSSPFEIKIDSRYTNMSYSNFINDAKSEVSLNNVKGELSIVSYSKGILNGELGCEYSWIENKIKLTETQTTTTLINLAPYGKIRLKTHKDWFISTALRHSNYDTKNIKRKITYLDAAFHYNPPRSRFEFELNATNVLNLNKTESVNLTLRENYFEERIYQMLPGYCLLKVIFRV